MGADVWCQFPLEPVGWPGSVVRTRVESAGLVTLAVCRGNMAASGWGPGVGEADVDEVH